MDWIILVSLMVKVAVAMAGIEAALWVLRRLDRRSGIDWIKDVWEVMNDDPKALALYFGLRFFGVAFLLGHAIS